MSKGPDFTPRRYMPSRTEMCRQLGTIVFGSADVFNAMPGTYGEQWYDLLEMVKELKASDEQQTM